MLLPLYNTTGGLLLCSISVDDTGGSVARNGVEICPYQLGQLVLIEAAFTSVNTCGPIDPLNVVAYVESPDGVETEYVYGVDPALRRTAAGTYQLAFVASQAGPWIYRWTGDGIVTPIASGDAYLQVTDSVF